MFAQTGKSPRTSYKVVLLGDARVGKSSIISYQTGYTDPLSTTPTVGCECHEFVFEVAKKTISLQVWDTAGQEMYRSLVPVYLRGSSGAIVVYDQTDKESFYSLKQWMSLIDDTLSPETAVLIAANKTDLAEDIVVDDETALQFAKAHNRKIFKVSALTGQGVNGLFTAMAELVAAKAQDEVDSSRIEIQNSEEKRCNC
jgi:small GTP-binding protein